ncbi:glycosyltransferase family 4 protein [soil metagenome]
MPRVLRIINRLNLGGPTYNAANLTAHLAPEFETVLMAGMKDDSEESSEFILEKAGIQPVYISNMKREIDVWNDREAYRQIVKFIRDFKPDIVHTHAAKAGTLGRIAAWRNKVPIVVHTFHGHVFHSYFSPTKTRVFLEIERMLAKISTGIIAISDDQKNDLGNIYKVCAPDKIKVIPLGFELERFSEAKLEKRKAFRAQYHLEEDTLAIGIIGRLVPVKNHALFIQAWKNVHASYPGKSHAFIIGDGEERQHLEALCTSAGINFETPEKEHPSAELTFTSWIHDIDRAMAGLDIIALTSFNEGTPVSLIEAQASGKAIVTTQVGGIGNAVIPGTTALLSPSGDVNAFSKNLSALMNNPELRGKMQESGPSFAVKKFGYERLIKDMREYYLDLLKIKG